jgi:hypothetical protein
MLSPPYPLFLWRGYGYFLFYDAPILEEQEFIIFLIAIPFPPFSFLFAMNFSLENGAVNGVLILG